MRIQEGFRRGARVQGKVDVRRGGRIDPKKLRSGDAGDGKQDIIHGDRGADGFRWISETFVAVGEAHYCYRGGSGPVVVIRYQPPCRGRNTKACEVIAGN